MTPETAHTRMDPGVLIHRYREQGDRYRWAWFTLEDGPVREGRLSARPDWLQAIVDAGRLGGHMYVMLTAPPMYVLWFKTDEQFNFIAFLSPEDPNA